MRRSPIWLAAITLGAAAIALAGCGRQSPEDARDALLAADRAAGATLERVLADDAFYLGPALPLLEGREAVAQELRGAAPAERQPLLAEVSTDGTQGYTAGRTRVGGDSAGAGHGKYLAYWRRGPDAGWRLWAIVVNPTPAVPDSLPLNTAAAATGQGSGPGTAVANDLLAADSAFSALADSVGAGPAFREFAEPSALALLGPDHGMIRGDSAIGAYFGRAIPPTDGLTWTPRVARLAPSGDLGFTIGDAVYRHRPAGGVEERFYTKYLTVWRRQSDGGWRYAADGGNDQPAPERRSDLRVRREAGALRLLNPDTAPAFYLAFEQRMTALVNWRPCVEPERCHMVQARGERVLPLDSVPGYDASADTVTVFWWRRSASTEGGSPFDSVRSVTVGLR